MKKQIINILPAFIICFSIANVAAADLRSDNFDDNSQAATWKKLEQDPVNCAVAETNNRLEVLANGNAIDMDAIYASKWNLMPDQNFQVKVDFFNNVNSWLWNEVYIGIGYKKEVDTFDQDYIYLAAGCDENYLVFWYEHVEDGASVTSNWKTRSSASGTLYISYDTSKDELYLSDTGYGSANAWKTFTGVLQGDWGGRAFGVGIGGSSELEIMTTGQAYLDNFVVDSGQICTSSPPGDLDNNCKVDFGDLAIMMLSWLDCNIDPQSACP
jgi:hypothetical protein